jgi:hypothetical protein
MSLANTQNSLYKLKRINGKKYVTRRSYIHLMLVQCYNYSKWHIFNETCALTFFYFEFAEKFDSEITIIGFRGVNEARAGDLFLLKFPFNIYVF